ncbi:MAG: nitroreductase family protein [Bacteroidota bacterium]
MEFTDLIRTRISIRNYNPDKPVPKETLERILEAGRLAPSAVNYQPWKFVVVSSTAMLDKVRACYDRDWFKEAPHVLIVVGFKDQAWKRSFDGLNSIETDMAIAMTHLILAAEDEGVGTCWIEHYNPAMLRDALNLKENQLVFGITPLGYPKEGYVKNLKKTRKPLTEIIEIL